MSTGVRCQHCRLIHTVRPDRLCPRCRKNVNASEPVFVELASTQPKQRSWGCQVLLLVLASLAAGSVYGYRYYRDADGVDYSIREGLLVPIHAGEWVESLDASARVQVSNDGWFRHTDPDSDRVLLSCPASDTHVVLRVETTGRGQRAPHSADLANRAIGWLAQRVDSIEVKKKEWLRDAPPTMHRVEAEVVVEQTRLVYHYRLASRSNRAATLACFGPPESVDQCPALLDSFSWSS